MLYEFFLIYSAQHVHNCFLQNNLKKLTTNIDTSVLLLFVSEITLLSISRIVQNSNFVCNDLSSLSIVIHT